MKNEQFTTGLTAEYLNPDLFDEFPALTALRPPDWEPGSRETIFAEQAQKRVLARLQAIYDKAEIYPRATVRGAWERDLPKIPLGSNSGFYSGLPKSEWERILDIPFTVIMPQKDLHNCNQYAHGFRSHVVCNFGITGVALVLDNSSRHTYCSVLIVDSPTECHWEVVNPIDRWFSDIGRGDYRAEDGYAFL